MDSTKALSIWRDDASEDKEIPKQRGAEPSAPIMYTRAGHKRPLAVRDNNLLSSPSPCIALPKSVLGPPTRSQSILMTPTLLEVSPGTIDPNQTESVHDLRLKSLPRLPQSYSLPRSLSTKGFGHSPAENSLASPSLIEHRAEHDLVYDGSEIWSRLVQSGVPLRVCCEANSDVLSHITEQTIKAIDDIDAEGHLLPEQETLDDVKGFFQQGHGLSNSLTPFSDDQFLGSPTCPPPTRSVTPMLSLYVTVKVSNIPWDISTEQIMEFLGKNTKLATYTSSCSPIHFVLDRTSGKTQSEIYLEMSSIVDAERLAQRRSGRSLGSRVVNIELVSSKEMLNATFPRVRNGYWIIQEEIQNLLTHARSHKSPYTRKCPQRPFENYISILVLFPWANRQIYTPSQVELLYNGYVGMVSTLQWHVGKGKLKGLDVALLRRLITAGTNLTEFSYEQKRAVCSSISFFPDTFAHLGVAGAHAGVAEEADGQAHSRKRERTQARPMHLTLLESKQVDVVVPSLQISECQEGSIMQSNGDATLPSAATLTKALQKSLVTTDQVVDERRSLSSLHPHQPSRLSSNSKLCSAEPENGPVLTPSDQWLVNARKAGIVVGRPVYLSVRPC